jgi:hypothetical protein
VAARPGGGSPAKDVEESKEKLAVDTPPIRVHDRPDRLRGAVRPAQAN